MTKSSQRSSWHHSWKTNSGHKKRRQMFDGLQSLHPSCQLRIFILHFAKVFVLSIHFELSKLFQKRKPLENQMHLKALILTATDADTTRGLCDTSG